MLCPFDCETSSWASWTSFSDTFDGIQTKSRDIEREAKCGGRACPDPEDLEDRRCNICATFDHSYPETSLQTNGATFDHSYSETSLQTNHYDLIMAFGAMRKHPYPAISSSDGTFESCFYIFRARTKKLEQLALRDKMNLLLAVGPAFIQ